jgi:hypothetical protein
MPLARHERLAAPDLSSTLRDITDSLTQAAEHIRQAAARLSELRADLLGDAAPAREAPMVPTRDGPKYGWAVRTLARRFKDWESKGWAERIGNRHYFSVDALDDPSLKPNANAKKRALPAPVERRPPKPAPKEKPPPVVRAAVEMTHSNPSALSISPAPLKRKAARARSAAPAASSPAARDRGAGAPQAPAIAPRRAVSESGR